MENLSIVRELPDTKSFMDTTIKDHIATFRPTIDKIKTSLLILGCSAISVAAVHNRDKMVFDDELAKAQSASAETGYKLGAKDGYAEARKDGLDWVRALHAYFLKLGVHEENINQAFAAANNIVNNLPDNCHISETYTRVCESK